MKALNRNSDLGNGLLLFAIVISIAGSFFSMLNRSASEETTRIPFIAIILSLIAIAATIKLYQKVANTKAEAIKVAQEIERMKRTQKNMVQEKEREEQQKQEQMKEKKHTENLDEIVQRVIPEKHHDNSVLFLEELLYNIAKQHEIVQAVAYSKQEDNLYSIAAAYAFFAETEHKPFAEGDTLPGQVAKNKTTLNLNNVPNDYISAMSGLGKSSPNHLLIVPVIDQSNNNCIALLELASFKPFEHDKQVLLEAIADKIVEPLLTIGNSTIQ